MGLGLSVGYLADMKIHDNEGYVWAKDTFAKIAEVLKDNHCPTWEEPEELNASLRPHLSSFPYSWIHFLRRAYAWQNEHPGENLPPSNGEISEEDDRMIEDVALDFRSHLLCHSDAEGHYVPIEFEEPIFDDRVDGSMLGSSFALKRELLRIAPLLDIKLEGDVLPDIEAARIYAIEDDHPFFREYAVFLSLWEVTRVSLEKKTAIVFC